MVYGLLADMAPEIGNRLHDFGWGPHGMRPMGHSMPVFPSARRRRGVYAAGGVGTLELGSPLPEVVEAWAQALQSRDLLDWGGVALRVEDVGVVDPPEFAAGRAVLRSLTPVVMKGSGRDGRGARTTRHAWLLPPEPEFASYFAQNLRRKAETLGLAPDVRLDEITWIGSKRSFAARGGARPGAPLEVALRGEPELLQAVWSWGLGQSNSTGFGWVIG